MAAAMRIRVANVARNYVQTLLLQSHTMKTKHKVCFHNSSFLYAVGQELKMPSLSPTMSDGTIVKWLKKEGDPIVPGDVLCDIQTDKAVVSFETEEEGVLAKILVREDAKDIKVGTVIALMVAEGEDWRSVEVPKSSDASSLAPPRPPSEPASKPGSGVTGQEVKMPSLSPTMSEGTILKWLKNEGDPVAPGDVLCDIQTDKAVMSFETEEEGVLAKILVQEDVRDVKVGALIALMVAPGEDWKNVEIPSSAAPLPSAPSPPSASKSGHKFEMPFAHKILAKRQVESRAKQTERLTPPPSSLGLGPNKSTGPRQVTSQKLLFFVNISLNVVNFLLYRILGPAVRVLLERYHLQSSRVTATGHKGKLLKGDVLKYIADNKLKPKAPKEVPLPAVPKAAAAAAAKPPKPSVRRQDGDGYTDIELTGIRRTIAKRLTESKTTIPHAYGVSDCTIDKLIALRKQLKEDGIKLSVNDFVIKAVALALQQCPQVNALYKGEQVVHPADIDVSVAVATENGLITPIVKAADAKGLEEISATVQDLAKKARDGKLQPHEFQGGTFTVSNLGMYGVDEFSAIINPPQCGILAVGGSRLVLDEERNPVTKMKITLSYDGRAVDEEIASEFLGVVREMLEDPSAMLLGGRGLRDKLGL
ncbi:pyruvate dehydrogenase protein X component-like [Zootermopsis nevadensis]|uniref:pyruvate dehydrogenase protein X component-like n=1 Tax=Zootermopsis nevadensis TaxID=136037 RepID=UPI000B8E2F32|nr:pyruvate dehydrogenase protein X component-like [Zootermopsis nevadensis]